MRSLLTLMLVVVSTTVVSAAPIVATVSLRDTGLTTNALIYDGAFDVYEVHLSNPNGAASVFVLSLPSLPGDYIQVGRTGFREDATLPLAFGFAAPDTFFVVPVNPFGLVCIDVFPSPCNPIDDAHTLEGTYVAPDVVPAGSSVIAVLSVPAGSAVPNFGPAGTVLGRAVIDGVFENIITPVPEPTTALLTLFGVAGFAIRRRC